MIDADEPPPWNVQDEGAPARFVIICDHAGRRIPRALGDLGLPPGEIDRHIGWDLGAAALSRVLAERLEACTVLQPYSRLAIDCNRAPDRPDAMPEVSDGTRVPGNIGLDEAGRRRRVDAIHAPYHDRIDRVLDARAAQGRETVLLLLHSFTPSMGGVARPWRFGVLHKGEALPRAVLTGLRKADAGPIGDNQPYAMDDVDYTAGRHGAARGLPHVEIEVRQDLLADEATRDVVADILARVLFEAVEEAAPHQESC